jgi:NSS family neurotransmitter:Na+ symporter
LNPAAETEIVGASNTGITFETMPALFAQMPGGSFFMVLFFLALSFAALTSLVSMLELATRVLVDRGLPRKSALLWVAAAALVFGAPSALDTNILDNQDWVWGVGLMLSGLFFALGARSFGLERLRTEVINGSGCDLPVGRWWSFLIGVVVPLEAVLLLVWWLVASIPDGTSAADWYLTVWTPYSAGTVLAQAGVALLALFAVNRWLAAGDPDSAGNARQEVAR